MGGRCRGGLEAAKPIRRGRKISYKEEGIGRDKVGEGQ